MALQGVARPKTIAFLSTVPTRVRPALRLLLRQTAHTANVPFSRYHMLHIQETQRGTEKHPEQSHGDSQHNQNNRHSSHLRQTVNRKQLKVSTSLALNALGWLCPLAKGDIVTSVAVFVPHRCCSCPVLVPSMLLSSV